MTILVLSLGSFMGLLIWAMILEIRFISPFTIIKTSNKEKWRKAAILALMQTAMIPVLGLSQLTLSPQSGQWQTILLFCGGLWIVVLIIAVLYKRWEFESHIKRYLYFDKMIKDKNSVYHRIHAIPFTNISRIFMTADLKRFFREGFPDSIDDKNVSEKQEAP